MTGHADTALPAVIPILPAVHSLLVLLTLGASGVIACVWALRRPRSWSVVIRTVWSQRWSLLLLAGLWGAGVMAFNWLTAESRAPGLAPAPLDGRWSHRGGNRRRGSVSGILGPSAADVLWAGGRRYTFFSSPAIVDDRVYCVGFRGNRGRVFCWDALSGRQLWTESMPGFRASFSSPVVVGRRLLTGEGLHHTPDAAIWCLDLRSGREGDVLWRFSTRSHVECTPAVSHGTVFVGAGDDGVYALSLDSGSDSAGRLLWHVPGHEAPDVETALCVHEEQVFVGLGIGGEALLVLSKDTGEVQKRIPMAYPVHGIPSVSNGRLFIGMGDGDYVRHENANGQICCVDLKSSELLWTYPTRGTVLGAVVCDEGGVVCACTRGWVYRVDCDGHLQREWSSGSAILASPAIAGDDIFIVTRAGRLHVLGRGDLKHRWELQIGEPGLYVSSPVIAHGCVYVGTPTSGFLCLGTVGPLRDQVDDSRRLATLQEVNPVERRLIGMTDAPAASFISGLSAGPEPAIVGLFSPAEGP